MLLTLVTETAWSPEVLRVHCTVLLILPLHLRYKGTINRFLLTRNLQYEPDSAETTEGRADKFRRRM